MKADDWKKRWAEDRIGFHADEVNRHLIEHVDLLTGGQPARVLVPLCGKSLDMTFLADAGHHVVGVELAEAGAKAYFESVGAAPEIADTSCGQTWSAGRVQIRVEDFFDTTAAAVGAITAAYDRAALVAMPPAQRTRYIDHLCALVPGGTILLISFEYDTSSMSGPPFSVADHEVRQGFGRHGAVTLLGDGDILDRAAQFRERGLTWLREAVWHIELGAG